MFVDMSLISRNKHEDEEHSQSENNNENKIEEETKLVIILNVLQSTRKKIMRLKMSNINH